MATPTEIQELTHFAISEVQKERRWTGNPGPQHADDPLRLLGIMQRIRTQNVKLTQPQADKLYEYFQTEAQQYRQQWHQYFPSTDAYKDVLANIKAMLGHMVR